MFEDQQQVTTLLAFLFVLAWDVREVDMRASPYDFSDLGLEPIGIETPEGKREYAAHQRPPWRLRRRTAGR